ncbi:MAG: hypothetical protein KatS3mg015_0060 [Fimbriimonadales bacterium]|nr:MAG: hypothetical protein KatS3mg015_0060 [Fimbriimonadales bacterium]
MRKLFVLVNAAAVLVLAGLVTPAATAEPEFVVDVGGAIYPLRWGQVDPVSEDLVAPYPRWRNLWAVCFKVGSRVGVRMHWEPGETPCAWLVTHSKLQSKLTAQTYWTEGACDAPGGHGTHEPGEIHWFPADVPGFVEYAELIGDVVTCAPIEFGGSTARTTEVFVVLDEPKAPMDPAWVSFLRYSCKWARYRPGPDGVSYWDAETRTENDAAQRQTLGFFFQRPGMFYNGGVGAEWISWDGAEYRYHLKDILDAWAGASYVPGECMDASVVDALALCSIGFSYLTRQIRSPALGFVTYPICAIGDDPLQDSLYSSWSWAFHSITVQRDQSFAGSTPVWDACAAQRENLIGQGYRNPPAYHQPDHSYWTQNGYWHTHVSGQPEGAHLGLTFDDLHGSWIPVRAEWWMGGGTTMFEDWIPSKVTTDPRP